MEEVRVYGFGSFFNNKTEFQDIDILILHHSILYESCQFSIRCKKYILASLPRADITMLSESEEHELSFLVKSKADYLGKVNETSAENDLDIIITKVRNNKC